MAIRISNIYSIRMTQNLNILNKSNSYFGKVEVYGEQLGFRLRKAECEQASRRIRTTYPFVQEFEFIPTSSLYRGRLDELEIVFLSQTEQSADILMQVDRRARGLGSFLSEAFETDESHIRLSITTQDLPNINEKLKQIISKHL